MSEYASPAGIYVTLRHLRKRPSSRVFADYLDACTSLQLSLLKLHIVSSYSLPRRMPTHAQFVAMVYALPHHDRYRDGARPHGVWRRDSQGIHDMSEPATDHLL